MLDPSDGGWGSRKLWITVLALNLVVLLGVIAAHWAALGPYLTILVGGITALVGLYFGASVGHNVVVATNAQSLADAQVTLNKDASSTDKQT